MRLALLCAATTWFVAPSGSDDNPGTVAEPFKTPQRAAALVRPGDTVELAAGRYGPLSLGPAQSNTVWRGPAGPSPAVLSGGRALSPVGTSWTRGAGGVWVLPDAAGATGFNQLFVEGHRRPRARTPVLTYPTVVQPGVAFTVRPADLAAVAWQPDEEPEVVVYDSWMASRRLAKSLSNGTLALAQSCRMGGGNSGNRYYLENSAKYRAAEGGRGIVAIC